MPIADEHQGGVRRYAIFTFVIDDQGGAPESVASRFIHSPHASSLEVSTRLRHREAFFMKRFKCLEKGFIFPFVDISFFSSYQNIEEMKRLLEPKDCVNFHDPDIHLQKGCYEEVQLVDPKRDMITTPIDEDDQFDLASESAESAEGGSKSRSKLVNPPGIQIGKDDYKKTRGYIVIAYKTMEYMYSREFLSSWKTWTGVRYICMQMPRQLGLRRIAFYRQLSSTSDFSYVLLIEVTNLLLYAAQTLNLMNRIKLRLCGSAGIFRETDFQVDLVTANILNIRTFYKPPEKPFSMPRKLGRLDSAETPGSINGHSQKAIQIHLADETAENKIENDSTNVDTLMQLLKQQEAATNKRRVIMEEPKKRHSLVPTEQPPTTIPEMTITPFSSLQTSGIDEELGLKKARVLENEEIAKNNGAIEVVPQKSQQQTRFMDEVMFEPKSHQQLFHHQSLQKQQKQKGPFQKQQPIYHQTINQMYPMEVSTATSSPIQHPSPYFAHYYQAATLPRPNYNQYGHVFSHPMDVTSQNLAAIQEVITNDYQKLYTYTANPIPTSPYGYVQPMHSSMMFDNYNSPIYSRTEWKNASAAYSKQPSGEETMRNLAEQFRSLRETPIIGSDPYLVSIGIENADSNIDAYANENRGGYVIDETTGVLYSGGRERSRSAAFLEEPHKMDRKQAEMNVMGHIGISQHRQPKKIDQLKEELENEQIQQKMIKAEKSMQSDQLQQKLLDAERLQKRILEVEKLQMQLADEEMMHQQQQQMSAEKEDLKRRKSHKMEEEAIVNERQARSQDRRKSEHVPSDQVESSNFSPKRRQLPKLPTEMVLMEEDVQPKRRHEKRDRGDIEVQKVEQKSIDHKIVDQVIDQKTVGRKSIDQKSIDYKMDQKSIDQKMDQKSIDQKMDQKSIDQKMDQKSIDQKMDQKSNDHKMDQKSIDQRSIDHRAIDRKIDHKSIDEKSMNHKSLPRAKEEKKQLMTTQEQPQQYQRAKSATRDEKSLERKKKLEDNGQPSKKVQSTVNEKLDTAEVAKEPLVSLAKRIQNDNDDKGPKVIKGTCELLILPEENQTKVVKNGKSHPSRSRSRDEKVNGKPTQETNPQKPKIKSILSSKSTSFEEQQPTTSKEYAQKNGKLDKKLKS